MADSKAHYGKVVLRVLILFTLLFLIGLITRMPAITLPQFYALHGLLAAPFCAALAQWHFQHKGCVWQLALATGVFALVLGMMSPVMGCGFATVAVITLVVGLVVQPKLSQARKLAVSVTFGALNYPCALVVGILFGIDYAPMVTAAVACIN